MIQEELFDRFVPAADVVYTPEPVARQIIEFLKPSGVCLDPCRGDGAFYNHLPEGRKYCEIAEGTDFFKHQEKADWIIGNPPYSNFSDFLHHSFSLADNVSFLVPTNKIFQRQLVMNMIANYGGIKSMIVYGAGTLLGFPFGFSVGNFHFQKDWKGPCEMLIGMNQIFRK